MPNQPRPVHQPFSWLATEELSANNDFLEIVYDISRGISLAIDLCHVSDLEEQAGEGEPDCHPAIGPAHREQMMLFAKSTAKLLAMYADQDIELINSAHMKAAVAGRDKKK